MPSYKSLAAAWDGRRPCSKTGGNHCLVFPHEYYLLTSVLTLIASPHHVLLAHHHYPPALTTPCPAAPTCPPTPSRPSSPVSRLHPNTVHSHHVLSPHCRSSPSFRERVKIESKEYKETGLFPAR
ncbi:hypothetical protein E2C01_088497 [Portunus trituberculatus]|uniref:Uncharacterized protein n=1 Tax=Portunus trituberculatus TaxID=210409 RepID=A0A5B7J6C1_PORTR|nr:hypothetical protein [Portunus trituberculatus]